MIFKVEESDAKKRLDLIVSEKAELSRSQAARLIDSGDVLVFGR